MESEKKDVWQSILSFIKNFGAIIVGVVGVIIAVIATSKPNKLEVPTKPTNKTDKDTNIHTDLTFGSGTLEHKTDKPTTDIINDITGKGK